MVSFGLFGAEKGSGEAMIILSIVKDLSSSAVKLWKEEERESDVRVWNDGGCESEVVGVKASCVSLSS